MYIYQPANRLPESNNSHLGMTLPASSMSFSGSNPQSEQSELNIRFALTAVAFAFRDACGRVDGGDLGVDGGANLQRHQSHKWRHRPN